MASQGHAAVRDSLLSVGSQLKAHVSLVTCQGRRHGQRWAGTSPPWAEGLKPWASEAYRCLEKGQRELRPAGASSVGTRHLLWLQLLERATQQKEEGTFPFSRELQLRTDTLNQFLSVFTEASSLEGGEGPPRPEHPQMLSVHSVARAPASRLPWCLTVSQLPWRRPGTGVDITPSSLSALTWEAE